MTTVPSINITQAKTSTYAIAFAVVGWGLALFLLFLFWGNRADYLELRKRVSSRDSIIAVRDARIAELANKSSELETKVVTETNTVVLRGRDRVVTVTGIQKIPHDSLKTRLLSEMQKAQGLPYVDLK